jgi:hypothetical protein
LHHLDDRANQRTRSVLLAAVATGVSHPLNFVFVKLREFVFLGLRFANLKAAGYVEQFCLGRAIAVSGRSLKGISDDLRRLIAWARER